MVDTAVCAVYESALLYRLRLLRMRGNIQNEQWCLRQEMPKLRKLLEANRRQGNVGGGINIAVKLSFVLLQVLSRIFIQG
jgi:hypothetical protein